MTNQVDEGVVKTTVPAHQGEKDVLEQLLKPEVQESITALVEQLPKLSEMVTQLTEIYETVNSLLTDDLLREETKKAVKDIVGPVSDSVKAVTRNVMEAKERAEESEEVIGLFGLLKIMKDPQAQKFFRFLNAYLEVSKENDKQ
jgi:uncharacterized protein YjgD (DUF1641 family)